MAFPDKFQGFGVDKHENWAHPKFVEYERRQLNAGDVAVEIECCGLCGSDIHTILGAWGAINRPDLVVGHEIIGKVVAVGDSVKEFKEGDRVGIGAAAFSCGECNRCHHDNEQYCTKKSGTYNAKDPRANGYITQGGYASHAIAGEQFVFAIPESLPLKYAAPLMCAGLTVFSPIVRNVGYDGGKKVGIIGLGGLGHLAVMFAHHLGHKVTVFSRSLAKRDQAKELGADDFVATGEEKDWADAHFDEFDFILNCASGVDGMALEEYLKTLVVNGRFVSVGLPPSDKKFEVSPATFLRMAGSFGASLLGSKAEAMKMLEIAAENKVYPWIEEVPISEQGCHEALTRCDAGDVRYRFVFTEFDKAFTNRGSKTRKLYRI